MIVSGFIKIIPNSPATKSTLYIIYLFGLFVNSFF